MSIIKSIKQVLGLGPAAENHFWDGSVPNQLSLKRGTPEAPGAEVLKVVNGKVSFPNQVQTWQDVKTTPGRLPATLYTNTTGQPITVCVSISSTAQCNMFVTVASVVVIVAFVPYTQLGSATFVVPDGASYKIEASSGTPTVFSWTELR